MIFTKITSNVIMKRPVRCVILFLIDKWPYMTNDINI